MANSRPIRIDSRCKPLSTPQAVANFFLEAATDDNRVLTPLQLLKLVYIAYGWTLAILDQKLFDERIEAWAYGPVVPSIYHEFKDFGSGPISSPSVETSVFGRVKYPIIPDEEKELLEVLGKVWQVYKNLSGNQLVDLTHKPGTPWDKVPNKDQRHACLDDEHIKQHYQELIKRGRLSI